MDQSLNELFSVILHSEKVAMDEKRKCIEVKERIETVRIRLEKQAEARTECTQKIDKLTDGLFQSMMGTKCVKSKEEFLAKNLNLILSEISCLTEKLENIKIRYETSSKTFMLLVQDFSYSYGISNNGRETRESEARADLKRLSTKMDTLSQELQSVSSRNEELSGLVCRLEEIKELRKLIAEQMKEYKTEIERKEYEILQLQKQRLQLETLPDTDETFTSLNDELQQYNIVELEETARDLQAELNRLLGSARQKEGQKLRQQYRQWQRQRQQMLRQEVDKQGDQSQATDNPKAADRRTCAASDEDLKE